jgi:opacity protein-like surface antigen
MSIRNLIRLLGLLACSAFIATHAAIRPMLSVGVGAAATDMNTSQSLTILAPFQNTYLGHTNDTESMGSLFLGAQITLPKNFEWQLGAAYYQSIVPFAPYGTVYQFGDPLFGNLNYTYNIESRRYLFQTKFLYSIMQFIHPYLSGAAGVAVNKSYSYSEIPVTSADVPMLGPFADKTYRAFAWSVGAGLEMDVHEHARFGVGYSYSHLGNAGLGIAPLQDSNDKLVLNNLTANEFFLQLSYIV